MPTETKTIAGVECHRCEPMAAWLPLASCLRQREDAIAHAAGRSVRGGAMETPPVGSPCVGCAEGARRASGATVAPLEVQWRSDRNVKRRLTAKVGTRFGSIVTLDEPYVCAMKRTTVVACECDCGSRVLMVLSALRAGRASQCRDCARRANGIHRRKFDADTVRAVRAMARDGLDYTQIAARTPVSWSSARSIVLGLTYTDVPDEVEAAE